MVDKQESLWWPTLGYPIRAYKRYGVMFPVFIAPGPHSSMLEEFLRINTLGCLVMTIYSTRLPGVYIYSTRLPGVYIYSTRLPGVYIYIDPQACMLAPVEAISLRKSQDLLPALAYMAHHNAEEIRGVRLE